MFRGKIKIISVALETQICSAYSTPFYFYFLSLFSMFISFYYSSSRGSKKLRKGLKGKVVK